MKKNIDLIIDGIAPEKVMYDTDNHSLVVLYPAQREFKVGDRVVLKSHSMKNLSSYNGFTYFRDMNTSNGSYIVIKEVKIYDDAEKQTAIYGTNSVTGKRYFYPIEWLEHHNAEFKKGDILTAVGAGWNETDITFVHKTYNELDNAFYILCGGVSYCPISKAKRLRDREIKYGFNINNVRYASDKEIEKFDNDLKEIDKKWNAETLEIEDIKPEFKRGDIVIHDNTKRVSIFDSYENKHSWFNAIFSIDRRGDIDYNESWVTDTIRYATSFEIEKFDNDLKEIGKKWNAETLQVEDLVEEFKRGDILASDDILLIFDEYATYNKEKDLFHSIWNNIRTTYNKNWTTKYFTYATDEQKAQVHELLRKESKRWNEETLEVEDLDISEIVYDLPTACEYLGKNIPAFSGFYMNYEDGKKWGAQIELQLMCEAWNKFEGFVVDYANLEQDKYFPVLDVHGDIKCLVSWGTAHISAFCYSFSTEKRAIQFGTQFKELFKTAMGL